MKCPKCKYPGEMQLVHVYPGGWRKQICLTCNGTNEIDDELGRRMEIGKRLRDERLASRKSQRERALELGASPVVLSWVEIGHLNEPATYELWNRLTGENLEVPSA